MSDFFLWHRSTIGHCKSQACIFGRSWRDGRGGRCHMLLAMTASKMRPSTFAGVKDQLSRKIMLRACALNQWLANTMWSTSLTPLRRRHAALTASVMAHVCSWLAVSCAQCQLCNKNAISSVAALTQTCCEQSGRATARDNTRLSSMVALVAIVNSACQHPSGVPSMMQRIGGPSWGNNSLREGRPTRVARVCARRVSGTSVKSVLPYLRVEANSSDVTRK